MHYHCRHLVIAEDNIWPTDRRCVFVTFLFQSEFRLAHTITTLHTAGAACSRSRSGPKRRINSRYGLWWSLSFGAAISMGLQRDQWMSIKCLSTSLFSVLSFFSVVSLELGLPSAWTLVSSLRRYLPAPASPFPRTSISTPLARIDAAAAAVALMPPTDGAAASRGTGPDEDCTVE